MKAMRFWQLSSILRDEEDILRQLVAHEKGVEFKQYIDNKEDVVLTQRRDIMDKMLPQELVFYGLSKSQKEFYIDSTCTVVFSYENAGAEKQIHILDLYKIVGSDLLEEVLEKTQIDIADLGMQKALEKFSCNNKQ